MYLSLKFFRLSDKFSAPTSDVKSVGLLESDSPYMSLWCRLQKASMKVLYMAMFVVVGKFQILFCTGNFQYCVKNVIN